MSNRLQDSYRSEDSDLRVAFERGRSRSLRSIPAGLRHPAEPAQDVVARDPLAQAEERRFEQGDYAVEAQRSKHQRGEAAKGTFHRLKLCALWFGAALFAVMNMVWLVHVAMPANWRWLAQSDLTLIQNVIGAVWVGKFGMLLERYANKHSDDE